MLAKAWPVNADATYDQESRKIGVRLTATPADLYNKSIAKLLGS